MNTNPSSTSGNPFLGSWKFFIGLVLLQFILLPYASKGFEWEASGEVIMFTLGNAIIHDLYGYSIFFQLIALFFLGGLFFWKEKVGKWFSLYVSVCCLLYAIIQNIAVTETYGVSVVTGNVCLMLLLFLIWFYDWLKGKTTYSFRNLNKKNYWLIGVALFCLWWPLNMQTLRPEFNPLFLFSQGSSLAFCPMTPIFLILLLLSGSDANQITLRVTAMVGTIIGIWNLSSLGHLSTFWLGIYHLPLLCISLYALVKSRTKKEVLCKETKKGALYV